MNNTGVYQINKQRILLSQIGDEGVMFDIEKNEYKLLNETLFKIFSGLQSGNTADEIYLALLNEYDITPEKCKQKVDEVIASLLQKEFILPA